MSSATKRARKTNFSQAEISVLLERILKEKEIINSALTNDVTNKRKQLVWTEIASEVTSLGTALRDDKEVKEKWKSLKSDYLKRRGDVKKTGGGPYLKQGLYDQFIIAIIGEESPLIEGLEVSVPDTMGIQVGPTPQNVEGIMPQSYSMELQEPGSSMISPTSDVPATAFRPLTPAALTATTAASTAFRPTSTSPAASMPTPTSHRTPTPSSSRSSKTTKKRSVRTQEVVGITACEEKYYLNQIAISECLLPILPKLDAACEAFTEVCRLKSKKLQMEIAKLEREEKREREREERRASEH